MKKLVVKTIVLLIPALIVPLVMILSDPFRIWFSYNSYFIGSSLMLNVEAVGLSLYEQNRKEFQYDSFIFGDSRSQAFKTKDWKKFLPPTSEPFHFNASSEGIYGILKKLEYLDGKKDSLKNVLIVMDEGTMMSNINKKGHLFITAPELSGESKFEYYRTFLYASMDAKFMFSYFKNKLSDEETADSYFSDLVLKGDSVSGDVWYWTYDEMIKKDSVSYYKRMMRLGHHIDKSEFVGSDTEKKRMTSIEKEQLKEMARILFAHGTNFKIVLSPNYRERTMSKERHEFLNTVFGTKNIYDCTGKSVYTENNGDWYEAHHFRPHLAKRILEDAYSKGVGN